MLARYLRDKVDTRIRYAKPGLSMLLDLLRRGVLRADDHGGGTVAHRLLNTPAGEVMREQLPRGIDYLGHGNTSLVLGASHLPSVVRLGIGSSHDPFFGRRPTIAGLLQSRDILRAPGMLGEVLPRLHMLGDLVDQGHGLDRGHHATISNFLQRLLSTQGYRHHDMGWNNIGVGEEHMPQISDSGGLEYTGEKGTLEGLDVSAIHDAVSRAHEARQNALRRG